MIVKIIKGRSQAEMRVGPLRFEPQRLLELVDCVLRVTTVFQRKGQVVVCSSIIRFECNRFLIGGDGLFPRFLLRELDCLLAIARGGLGKAGPRNQKNESQPGQHEESVSER